MATIPDVCKTPSPGGPVPIPYPNIATEQDLAKGTTTVKADGGNMCANYGSEFFKSTGDEPGVAGGVASSTFIKEATWITYSFNVKLESKGACRLTDKMFHNHQNTVNTAGKIHSSLSTADKKLVDCILELCKKDKDVVQKAKKLEIIARNPKKIDLFRYKGGKWTQSTVTSLGSARGKTVWVNRNLSCDELKDTIYHEVVHTDQPPSMPAPDKEMDAYTKTEKWMIDRGIPGNPDFRKMDSTGKVSVDTDAIRSHVQDTYGYNIPKGGAPLPPQVTGKTPDGSQVILDDGSLRPVQEGDAFKTVPPQNLDEQRIPPDELNCP